MTEVMCEQIVLAWSSSNLLGVSGLGPVAASPGWKLSASDKFAGLGEAARYLPEDASSRINGDNPLPVCLEYRPTAAGALLLSKVYSTSSRRAGQYQVHALRAPKGLSPWDLWQLAHDGVLWQQEHTDYQTSLDPVMVTPAKPPDLPAEGSDVGPLARLLQCLNEDRPYLVLASNQKQAVAAAEALLSYLPLGLVQDIPVSTFLPSPKGWPAGIGLLVPPHSQRVDSPDLTLVPYRFEPAANSYLLLAERFVDPAAGRPPQLASLNDLHAWMALERADLMTVPISQLRGSLSPSLFTGLLDKIVRHPRSGQALSRILEDSATEEEFAARLRADGPENADLVAALVRLVGATDSVHAAPSQKWLLYAVGEDQFVKYVLPSLQVEARTTDVTVRSPELAQLLASSATAADLVPFRFAVSPPAWSRVCEAEFGNYLRDQRPMTANSRALLHTSPERAARYLDEQLAAGTWQADDLEAAARKCPDDFVPDLIAILLQSSETPADWPVRILGRRKPELVRDVLTARWPQIAARLGIPIGVAEMLQVRKKSLWKMVLSDDA